MASMIRLIPIDRGSRPRGFGGTLPEVAAEVFCATAKLYDSVGFLGPWVGYLSLANDKPVGTCGFKSSPIDGRVEIAYFSFPEFEGRGFATAMATELVAIARQQQLSVIQTLSERKASHRVLEKLRFRHVATFDHPEDGTVWEWRLSAETGT